MSLVDVQTASNDAIDRIRARDGYAKFDMALHQRRKRVRADIEDIAPGRMHDTADACGLTRIPGVPDKPKAMRERAKPAVEQIVAKRQAAHEANEAAPARESRQVRRARERRIAKDAVGIAKTQPLSDAQIITHVLEAAAAARRRAAGGEKQAVRRTARVKWNLSPVLAHEILKAQGFRCALTGEAFLGSSGYGTSNPFAASPNRINPGGDYTGANCEFVCWWVNRLIGDMPRTAAVQFLRERGLLRKDFGQLAML